MKQSSAEARAGASVGARIRTTRESKMISQHELAQLLGVTPAAVCQWETKGTTPRSRTLKKVAEALNVSEDYLVTGAEILPPTAEGAESVTVYIERVKAKIAEATGVEIGKIVLEITLTG